MEADPLFLFELLGPLLELLGWHSHLFLIDFLLLIVFELLLQIVAIPVMIFVALGNNFNRRLQRRGRPWRL